MKEKFHKIQFEVFPHLAMPVFIFLFILAGAIAP